MMGSHLMEFLVLLTFLPSGSTIEKLNSINKLKRIPFGRSVPKHSLALLHWFANTIELDNNAIELTFEPDNGDYGAHHYGNYEGLLDPLPRGHVSYYSLGNLHNNPYGTLTLPSYFTGRLDRLMGEEEQNRGRIIIRLRDWNFIDQVYITQHYEADQQQGALYDPQHTYQITTNLLRELREFSLDQREPWELSEIRDHFGSGINNHQLDSLRNRWGQLVCLGLLVFMVIRDKNLPCRANRPRARQPLQANRQPQQNTGASTTRGTVVNIPENNPRQSPNCCCKCIILTLIFLALIFFTIKNQKNL